MIKFKSTRHSLFDFLWNISESSIHYGHEIRFQQWNNVSIVASLPKTINKKCTQISPLLLSLTSYRLPHTHLTVGRAKLCMCEGEEYFGVLKNHNQEHKIEKFLKFRKNALGQSKEP